MHDSEKSDSAIVAVKPPNKAGLPVAEAVERRAGAKGNADQQSTLRTRSQERVTQALDRVRQTATGQRFAVKRRPQGVEGGWLAVQSRLRAISSNRTQSMRRNAAAGLAIVLFLCGYQSRPQLPPTPVIGATCQTLFGQLSSSNPTPIRRRLHLPRIGRRNSGRHIGTLSGVGSPHNCLAFSIGAMQILTSARSGFRVVSRPLPAHLGMMRMCRGRVKTPALKLSVESFSRFRVIENLLMTAIWGRE